MIAHTCFFQSDLAETERSQLQASKDEDASEFLIKPDEYLRLLMPPSSETELIDFVYFTDIFVGTRKLHRS